jgi:hypothetical protein
MQTTFGVPYGSATFEEVDAWCRSKPFATGTRCWASEEQIGDRTYIYILLDRLLTDDEIQLLKDRWGRFDKRRKARKL